MAEHLEIGMERGEMPRHVGAEIFGNPFGRPMQLRLVVVLPGDEQRGDLEPHVGFVLEKLERLEHRRQLAEAKLAVELLGEALQVHIRRVHVPVKFGP